MGTVDILAGCLPFFIFIMHPSSFFDLRARYIYTPLHGPYSLSEALEGLIFYPLDTSRDFVSIGSKGLLRHELVSELSNVVDDLQDYLVYFSSTFLISPSASPDLIKELQTSCEDFKYLTICWRALITRLATARKIVECNFWPHFFQPSIDKLASLRKLKHRPPFVLPNASWKKSFSPASPSFPSSQIHSTPRSPHCLLDSQRLPLNVRSKDPETIPSKGDPTGGKEDCTSFRTLSSTPTRSVSHPARISSSHQHSVAPFNLDCTWSYENSSNEVFPLPNRPRAAQCSCGSIPAHADDARDSGDLKDNAKVVGMDEQVSRETEVAGVGEEVTGVPSVRLPPIQLPCSQGDTTKGLVTRPAGTSSSSSTSRLTSSATCIPCPIPNLHEGPTMLPPCSIPLPQAFANANSQPPTFLSSKGQPPKCLVLSNPFPSLSIAQKQPLKPQSRHFGTSSAHSPNTPPFQQHAFSFQSTPQCPASHYPYPSIPLYTTRAPATMSPPPMAAQPASTTQAPARTSSLTTASRFTSTASHISHFTANLHLEPSIPQPSARLLSKRQRAKRSTSSPPSHSLPTTQKRLSKAQP